MLLCSCKSHSRLQSGARGNHHRGTSPIPRFFPECPFSRPSLSKRGLGERPPIIEASGADLLNRRKAAGGAQTGNWFSVLPGRGEADQRRKWLTSRSLPFGARLNTSQLQALPTSKFAAPSLLDSIRHKVQSVFLISPSSNLPTGGSSVAQSKHIQTRSKKQNSIRNAPVVHAHSPLYGHTQR